MALIRLSAILVLSFATFCQTSQEPGEIAFANRTGTHLLTVPTEWESAHTPDRLSRALCAGNRLLEVVFEQHQKEGPQSSGRRTSKNFEQTEGDRYRISNGKVRDDEVCLLVSKDFLADKSMLPLRRWEGFGRGSMAQPEDCTQQTNASLSRTVGRAVARCSVLADLGNTRLVAAEFKPLGKDLLAALALVDKGKLRLHLDKATCADGSSAWRVDDGCEFNPAQLVPLIAWKRQDGEIEFVIEWAAPEAGALILYRTSRDKLQGGTVASRYWAP